MGDKHERALAGGSRRMGRTDMVVSRLGYGAMELAGPPKARALDEAETIAFLNRIVDSGINYIDTSIDYGLSERLIGKALSHRRHDFFLASKCACEVGVEHVKDGHEKHTYTGENVVAGVHQSLRRLNTTHLDVVQVHGNPTRRELEDGGVIDALLGLQKAGDVRYFGISSRLPLLAEFIDVECFSVVQVPYSALQRTNEDVIRSLREAGKAVVTRGVTGRGAPAKGWATRPIGTAAGEVRELWERAELDALLGGMSRIEFMIRFAISNHDVDVALVATTNPAHLEADIAFAAKGPLDEDLYCTARKRIAEAGGGPGQGTYKSGGPTPIM
ncbi:MAG: aldo/keto reductase [Beijerinckiaceae bacterium]|nr:aldo/keto reductase [Beijerinckiaceae bacterium]MDO9440906.1 aldo/keto reductase [Beijerinckiaceae bacterium]